MNKRTGFTIVELLVVIVVIGILAAITILSYSGIRQKAIVASLQSDLSSSAKSLKLFHGENGAYPITISTDCVNKPDSSNNKCLKASNGNNYTSYFADGASSSQGFMLFNANGSNTCVITNDSAPSCITGGMMIASEGLGSPDGHACSVASNGKAYCWGWNAYGQLGNNSTTNSSIPVEVTTSGVLNGKTIRSIALSNHNSCVVTSDNKAYCWGSNMDGQIGNNSTVSSSVPVAVFSNGVLFGKTINSIAAGVGSTCVIASDGKAYCWGRNDAGQLGNGTTTNSSVPVAVTTSGVLNEKTTISITTGLHTCVITTNGQAYCWGSNASGELGNNSDVNSSVPVAVDVSGISGKTFKSISAGGAHTCAIASDDQAYCWGANMYGQLGNNSDVDSPVPVAVDVSGISGKTFKSISAGNAHTCAITSDQKAYCWGYNSGRFGNNSDVSSPVPVAVDVSGVLSGKTIRVIAAGVGSTCVIASDYRTYCWGGNSVGGLGNNSTANSLVPVAVVPIGS